MADRYNYSLTTFSETGQLSQIEAALNAANRGGLLVGIKVEGGVVLATEKRGNSPLMALDSFEKISRVCSAIGVSYAGLGPDARVLTDSIRKTAQKYKMAYGGEEPSPVYLVQDVSETVQEYTQRGGVRPFGVSILLAGICDETRRPMLYQVDPSGAFLSWNACALGKGAEAATKFLERRHKDEADIEDAIHLAILTLRNNIDGLLEAQSMEIATATVENGKCIFRKLLAEEIRDHLSNAPAY